MSSNVLILRLVLAFLVLMGVYAIPLNFEISFFAKWAAMFASLMLGAPLPEFSDGAWLLILRSGDVAINASCSGVAFFGVLAASIFWVSTQNVTSLKACSVYFVISTFIALPLSILINASRIFTCSYAMPIYEIFLGTRFLGIFHMTCGVVCFFISLMIISILTMKVCEYVSKNKRLPEF